MRKSKGSSGVAGPTLLATQPDTPQGNLETVVGSLCGPWANGIHLVRSLPHRRPELVDDAVPLVIELLRGDEERCHTWAAVTLGEFAPLRARPALPLLREALLGESAALRRVAAAAISEMGPGALALRPDLERAAEEDPSLDDYLWKWWNSPWRLEEVSVEDLELVTLTYAEADPPRAFALHVEGRVWELKPGDRLLNAEDLPVRSHGRQ